MIRNDNSQMTARPRYEMAFQYAPRSWSRGILQYYVLAALFLFGTALKPLLGDDNRNLLLIGFMALSPALLLTRRIPRNHLVLYLFMISIALFPPLIHPEYIRWSTVFYTLMFSFSFIAYENVLRRSKVDVARFTKAVRFLLLAYIITLIAQQFSVLTGLPIINESNYSLIARWKLNSLSAEASHAARIINVLMFAYLSLEEIKAKESYLLKSRFHSDRFIWIGYIWSILSIQSTTAILFLPIILFKVMSRKNVGYALGAVGLILLATTSTTNDMVERLIILIEAVATFDYRLMIAADHSGSLRIAPLFVLAELVDIFSWQGIFGHGIDTVSAFMSDYVSGVPQGYTGGGMLRVWYEYGFIAFLLFVIFTMRAASALRSVSNFIFWLLIVFIAGPNNQIVWFYLIIFTSISYFRTSHLSARARHVV